VAPAKNSIHLSFVSRLLFKTFRPHFLELSRVPMLYPAGVNRTIEASVDAS
jgi:hypothetical protein